MSTVAYFVIVVLSLDRRSHDVCCWSSYI